MQAVPQETKGEGCSKTKNGYGYKLKSEEDYVLRQTKPPQVESKLHIEGMMVFLVIQRYFFRCLGQPHQYLLSPSPLSK